MISKHMGTKEILTHVDFRTPTHFKMFIDLLLHHVMMKDNVDITQILCR